MTTEDRFNIYNNIPTPCFLLELPRLEANLKLMRRVQEQAGVDVILALKGFSMWSVFSLVKQYLAGATASSLNEALLCFEEMGSRAHTYAAAYMPDEFDQIIAHSSHITFNSLNEAARYHKQVLAHINPPSMGLRLNPEYSPVETDLYNPAAPGSRLGMDPVHVARGIPDYIEGLHFHNLCESTAQDLANTINAIEHRYSHLLGQISWINFGGGHLMTRQGYDVHLLIETLRAFKVRWPNIKTVTLEPGSAVAWDCGPLLSRVLDVVNNHGIATLMVDVSFTGHMPDTLEMPYRPRILGATDPVPGKPTYRIGGTSCLSGDFMEAYSFDKEVQVGDLIVFEDMIHYTMVKTTFFNGVRHPDIATLDHQNNYNLIRRFTYLDYKRRLS
jgi:carboxynorspermidine decarboxylase